MLTRACAARGAELRAATRKGQADMPKMKTRKCVAKRYKVTGSGKITRRRPGRKHLMRKKNSKRKRRLAMDVVLQGGDHLRIKKAMPYSEAR